jgi:hypothetical protein
MAAVETSEGARMPDPSAAGGQADGRRDFRLSFAGLLTTMALASLDQNIVSTALPRIVGELGGLAYLPWVITAFMLTAAATAPLYGKLSDMHGRRPALRRRDCGLHRRFGSQLPCPAQWRNSASMSRRL